jgi:ABC-type sugar transport system ATPase subunit
MKLSSNLSTPIVSMKRIGKIFGKVRVLENVDFDIHPGEVHILAGENGAGKSTLIKILSGVYSSSEGTIMMNGSEIAPQTPLEANSIGISVIHQELSLVPSMSVKDNLFLGRPHTRAGFILDKEHHRQALSVLSKMGIYVDIDEKIENIPISIQQLIEIAKALSINSRVIIMDEPSSALNVKDVEILFSLIEKLKKQGAGIVYISHRMEEIKRLADRITVLRDGELIGTALAADLPIPKLINWMVGRDLIDRFPRHDTSTGVEKLRIENLTVKNKVGSKTVDNVSISVNAGEILGIAGLQGSGTSELLMGIFGGYKTNAADHFFLNGEEIIIKSPSDAIKKNIALLTNDRKATGLVLPMSLTANICMAGLKNLTKWGWRKRSKEKISAKKHGTELSIRAYSYDMEVNMLSGGNQQKVAIGKWMQISPQILLLDEPTRGIDIGAKHEIYQLMNEWTNQGISILLITSEMPELLAMSDRILVMHRGSITAEYMRNEFNAEKILEAAMGKEKLQ